jgi:maltose-binding protein MalE
MVRKWQSLPVIALIVALLSAACTPKSDQTTITPAPSVPVVSSTITTQAGEADKLLVWVDEERASVVEAAAQAFETASGTVVEVEVMPFFEIRAAVTEAIPAGRGPDLFIDANEGTGALAEAGLIARLDLEGREGEFLSVGLDAFTYGGDLYALPLAVEAVGLFYNRDLVPEPPADFGTLRTVCDGLGLPSAAGVPCLALPAGEPLHQFPFVAGFGGYIFGLEDGAYDLADVGLDSPGAIAGATFLDGLYRDGYADDAIDYPAMADLFNQGLVPFMWTGPWQVDAVDAAGINYGIARLPVMDGNPPRPFVGSQGFFLNGLTEQAEQAGSFLLDFIASRETMVQLAIVTNRPPALLSALDELAEDLRLAVFAESASGGLPLPNLPEMEAAWGPLTDAFVAISRGSGNPATVMTDAAGLVRATLPGG